jgi:hypothetical protein
MVASCPENLCAVEGRIPVLEAFFLPGKSRYCPPQHWAPGGPEEAVGARLNWLCHPALPLSLHYGGNVSCLTNPHTPRQGCQYSTIKILALPNLNFRQSTNIV